MRVILDININTMFKITHAVLFLMLKYCQGDIEYESHHLASAASIVAYIVHMRQQHDEHAYVSARVAIGFLYILDTVSILDLNLVGRLKPYCYPVYVHQSSLVV